MYENVELKIPLKKRNQMIFVFFVSLQITSCWNKELLITVSDRNANTWVSTAVSANASISSE